MITIVKMSYITVFILFIILFNSILVDSSKYSYKKCLPVNVTFPISYENNEISNIIEYDLDFGPRCFNYTKQIRIFFMYEETDIHLDLQDKAECIDIIYELMKRFDNHRNCTICLNEFKFTNTISHYYSYELTSFDCFTPDFSLFRVVFTISDMKTIIETYYELSTKNYTYCNLFGEFILWNNQLGIHFCLIDNNEEMDEIKIIGEALIFKEINVDSMRKSGKKLYLLVGFGLLTFNMLCFYYHCQRYNEEASSTSNVLFVSDTKFM